MEAVRGPVAVGANLTSMGAARVSWNARSAGRSRDEVAGMLPTIPMPRMLSGAKSKASQDAQIEEGRSRSGMRFHRSCHSSVRLVLRA